MTQHFAVYVALVGCAGCSLANTVPHRTMCSGAPIQPGPAEPRAMPGPAKMAAATLRAQVRHPPWWSTKSISARQ